MSQRVKRSSVSNDHPSRTETPGSSKGDKKRRVLPQTPAPDNKPILVARGDETTIDLTTVTDLSTVSELTQNTTVNGKHSSIREFISPVKFTDDGEDSCVTVAVRVRPFSDRELNQQEPKPIIRMHGNEVIIKSKDDIVHRFYYDHCFWSLPEGAPGEGGAGRRSLTPHYATQKSVYEELAQPLLDRSFEGYNTCLFAYGQTGSGKSYCIMGEGEAIGIVPRFAQELFDRVEGTTDEETSFKVQVSYYEIYKEKIYDLLASNQQRTKKRLRVREHPVLGPYVEDLSTFVADSYPDIERWINLGNRFRATAATGMNERSSRSHSVFTITLTQIMMFEGEEQCKVSRINLIDLAGSERSSVSRTSGERLKEGVSINKSLHSLGKVISLLSEKGSGRRKKVFIPYRDSTLTWLLKESLGGNSKTAMIATVSPSMLHYDESLSTLRYAQQARTIVNVAHVNEDPNAAIIRDLRQQIEQLKGLLQTGSEPQTTEDSVELKTLREKLLESEKLMAETTRSWQEKLRQSEARKQEELELLKRSGALTVNNKQPNLVNLTEDPQLSEIVVYFLKDGVTTVGRRGGAESHDIELSGALIISSHCSLTNENGAVTLHPSASTDAQTYLNGELTASSVQLHHGDRIVLGGEYFFRFNHPLEVEGGVYLTKGQGTFQYAKDELIRAQTARLEAELEERRLREHEAMMGELQSLRDAAQRDIDQQREEYEGRLASLTREMAEQSMEASHHQRSSEEARAAMEELRERNKALEEETMTQKHLIHLEKLKAEREYKEIKEEKTRLMSDLEQEKNKLLADIQQLSKNKAMRMSISRKESTLPVPSTEPSRKGSEMVRLAMMLQEASAISKSLNKPLTFSRDELINDSGGLEVQVRVNNTQQSIVTFWSLEKFETRLELMRDMYSNMLSSGIGSTTSLEAESVGSCEEGDPFSDPSDSWVKESLITPQPSPLRSASVRNLLLSSGSTHSTTLPSSTGPLPTPLHNFTGSLPPRSLLDLLNSSMGSSRGNSPLIPPRPDHTHFSLLTILQQRVSGLLGAGLEVESAFQKMLGKVVELRGACECIEEQCREWSSQQDKSGSLASTPAITQAALSLCSFLELLLAEGQALHRELIARHSLLARLLSNYFDKGVVKKTSEGLVETISQQTALYCSRLLQAIDNESEEAVGEASAGLRESLDLLTRQTGSLCLTEKVMNHTLHSQVLTTSTSRGRVECGKSEEEGEFLTLKPYQKSAVLFYQGYCDLCSSALEHTVQIVKECLDTITGQTNTEQSEVVTGVVRAIIAVEAFLQRLAEIQDDVWSTSPPSEGTLPVTPPLSQVVELLSLVQQLESSVSIITTHTVSYTTTNLAEGSQQDLSSSNIQMARCCNELAATALRVITGSQCKQAQNYAVEVQQLSYEIARAGRTINHLTKRNGNGERVRKRRDSSKKAQETKPAEMVKTTKQIETVLVVDKVSIAEVADTSETQTSMATGQVTQSPEHVTVNRNHMTSKEDYVTVGTGIVDDKEDSTLI